MLAHVLEIPSPKLLNPPLSQFQAFDAVFFMPCLPFQISSKKSAIAPQTLFQVFEIPLNTLSITLLIALIASLNNRLIPCLPFQISSKMSEILFHVFDHVFEISFRTSPNTSEIALIASLNSRLMP